MQNEEKMRVSISDSKETEHDIDGRAERARSALHIHFPILPSCWN